MSTKRALPRILTYAWEGEDLALTFRTPTGTVESVKFGRKHSRAPLRLHGTIWPHRHSNDYMKPDEDIGFMVESPQGMLAYIFLCDDSLALYEFVCLDRPKHPQLLAILYDADSFTVRYSVAGVEVEDLTISIFPSRHAYRLLEFSSSAQSARREYTPVLSFTVESAEGETLELRFSVDPGEIKEIYTNLSAFVRSFDYPKAEAVIISYAYLQAA